MTHTFSLAEGVSVDVEIYEGKNGCIITSEKFNLPSGCYRHCKVTCYNGKWKAWDCSCGERCDGDCVGGVPKGTCSPMVAE